MQDPDFSEVVAAKTNGPNGPTPRASAGVAAAIGTCVRCELDLCCCDISCKKP